VSRLYSAYYLHWCNENGKLPASAEKYGRILCFRYNTGSQLLQSDTCRVCDELITKNTEVVTEGRESETKKLKEHYTLHLDEVKEMQDSFKTEKEHATASLQFGLAVLTMDQQQVQTPRSYPVNLDFTNVNCGLTSM
jgi:hypothetical protein